MGSGLGHVVPARLCDMIGGKTGKDLAVFPGTTRENSGWSGQHVTHPASAKIDRGASIRSAGDRVAAT